MASNIQEIKFEKAFWNGIPVAQKSLAKLEDRIQNAMDTIYLAEPKTKLKKVLFVDDALGSGATLNEMAKKLRRAGVETVIGFAIVGSYEGFETLSEI